MSSLRAPWQKHREQHRNMQNNKTQQTFRKKMFLCFSDSSICIFNLWFPKWFLQEMLSYRPGTFNDVHWRFKPVLSYSKPHIFSTLYGLGLQSALQEPPLSACQAYLYGLPRRLNSTSPPTSDCSSSTRHLIV